MGFGGVCLFQRVLFDITLRIAFMSGIVLCATLHVD